MLQPLDFKLDRIVQTTLSRIRLSDMGEPRIRLNQDGSIGVFNFVGPHDIEMLVGAEKPYIQGWHCGAVTPAQELKE